MTIYKMIVYKLFFWSVSLCSKFIPLHRWRTKFRNRFLKKDIFSCYKSRFIEIKTKKHYLKALDKNIEYLFLGSPHTAYGIIPNIFSKIAFNLGTTSQDWFTSFYLLTKIEDSLKNLKVVFLEYSFFLEGFELAKCKKSGQDLICFYNYFYQIDYPVTKYLFSFQEMARYLNVYPIKKSENGFIRCSAPIIMGINDSENKHLKKCKNGSNKCSAPIVLDIEDRVSKHLKHFNRPDSQLFWVEKIYDWAQKHKVELCIVSYPCRKDYRNLCERALGKKNLFNRIEQLCSKYNLRFFNFYDDLDFGDEDFYDSDHLNFKGAEKLTAKLKTSYKDEFTKVEE